MEKIHTLKQKTPKKNSTEIRTRICICTNLNGDPRPLLNSTACVYDWIAIKKFDTVNPLRLEQIDVYFFCNCSRLFTHNEGKLPFWRDLKPTWSSLDLL